MKKRRKKTKRKSNALAKAQQKLFRATLLFVFAFLAVIFLFGDHGVYQLYRIKMLRNATQKRIDELQVEKQTYVDEKNRLENDLNYIETLAREKYRMAKAGEKVFKVIPKEK